MFNLVVSQRNTFLHFQAVRKNALRAKRRSSAPPCFKTLEEPISREGPAALQVLQVECDEGAALHEEATIQQVPAAKMPKRVAKWSDADDEETSTYPDEAWTSTTSGASSDGGSTAGEENQRATWMLKNVPGRVTKDEVLHAIAQLGFAGTYDYFYMPTKLSGNTYVSRGYAFIGFADFEVGDRFRETITGFQFPGRRSTKRIEVSPARLHSLEDIEDHFKSFVGSERGPIIKGAELGGQSAPAAALPAHAADNSHWQRQQRSMRHVTPAMYGTPGFQASGGMAAVGFGNHFGAQQYFQQGAYPRW